MIPAKDEVILIIGKSDKETPTDERIRSAAMEYLSESVGQIAREERGKPYFPDRPDLHTSVSHSGEYFVCAFSGSPVGVDIQEHTLHRGETPESAVPRLKKTARRFFHPVEADYTDSDTYERFFRVWTAKEALVKYTGRGIDNDFSSLLVVVDNMPELGVGKPARWQSDGCFFFQMKQGEDYTLSVCSGENFKIDIR